MIWRNWLCTVSYGMLPEVSCPCSPAHAYVFLCLQNVSLASLKLQHPVTSVSHVLQTPRGWALGLCFVLVQMASTGPQPTPLLDPAQVTSPLHL